MAAEAQIKSTHLGCESTCRPLLGTECTNILRQPPKITSASSHGRCSYASGPYTVGGLVCSWRTILRHTPHKKIGRWLRTTALHDRARTLMRARGRIIIDFAAAFQQKRRRRLSSQRGGYIRMRNRRRVLGQTAVTTRIATYVNADL